MIIITPGLWIKKSTINSEIKEIIRIIGEDPNVEGSWLTTDNSSSTFGQNVSVPDYIIEREYELLRPLEFYKKPAPNLKFGDISETPHEEQTGFDNTKIQQGFNNNNVDLKEQPHRLTPVTPITEPVKESPQPVVKQIKLEEQVFKKLDKDDFKKQDWVLSFDIPDLKKLDNICEFLDIDIEKIIDMYIQSIEGEVITKFKEALLSKLHCDKTGSVVIPEPNGIPGVDYGAKNFPGKKVYGLITDDPGFYDSPYGADGKIGPPDDPIEDTDVSGQAIDIPKIDLLGDTGKNGIKEIGNWDEPYEPHGKWNDSDFDDEVPLILSEGAEDLNKSLEKEIDEVDKFIKKLN